jgi:hypothetical protein
MTYSFLNKSLTNETAIFFLFVTYSLHILRNVSLILYFLLFMFSYFLVFITYSKYSNKSRKDLLIVFFFITFAFVPFTSLLNLPFSQFMTALSRFLPSFLFLLTFIIFKPNNYRLYIKIYIFFIFFTFLSASSIIIQFLLNFSFDFLADSGGRDGLTRYASFLGSLTTFGTLGPYAIFSIILIWDKKLSIKNKLMLIFAIIIIIIASILNLQKASIINLIVVLLFFSVFFLSPLKTLFFILLISTILLTTILLFPTSFIVTTFLSLIEYTFFNEYYNFYIDLLNRLGFYVRQFLSLNEFYFYNFIWGFGFKASSGTLGLPFYTNFHNIYYEMFFSGGFFHLFLFIVLLFRTISLNFKVFNKTKIIKVKTFSKFIFLSVLYFMINMLIGASTIYHPIGGSLVIVLIFFSRSNYRNIKSSLLN